MSATNISEIRDSNGNIITYRVTVTDQNGRQYTSDIDVATAVGIGIGDLVQNVVSQLQSAAPPATVTNAPVAGTVTIAPAVGTVIAKPAVQAIATQIQVKQKAGQR